MSFNQNRDNDNMNRFEESSAPSKQALRFLGVAGGITLFDWTLFAILCFFLSPSVAFVISFTTAVVIRFWLDRKITFVAREGNWRWQLFRYVLSCGIIFCVSFFGFQLARYFGVSQFPAKVFSTGCGTIFGFCLFKFFVFAQSVVWAPSPERARDELRVTLRPPSWSDSRATLVSDTLTDSA
jgi:putative flippase GtrA